MDVTSDARNHFPMRPHFVALVAFLSVALFTAPTPRPDEPMFVMEIIPSQDALHPGVPVWKKGAPVFFMIRMTNNSDHTLHFALTSPAVNYRAIVLDANGNPVPETKALRETHESIRSGLWATGRNVLVELQPHETQSDGIEISSYYDLWKPGIYTVQLERDSPPEIGTGVVASNQVKIGIEE